MHLCADTKSDLATSKQAGTEAKKALGDLADKMEKIAKKGEALANAMQKEFGGAGDPAASALMQKAKIWGGKCIHDADDGNGLAAEVVKGISAVEKMKGKDFTDYDNAKDAEDAMSGLSDSTEKAETETEMLQGIFDDLQPAFDAKAIKDASKQYYPMMYFVDKEFKDVPQTCGGDAVGQPLMGLDEDGCAASCDAHPSKCVGFGYFGRDVDSLCFLYSKFKSVQYWTGCAAPSARPVKRPSKLLFLQRGGDIIKCQAKFQKFDGLSMQPKKNGKCDICLKEVTKAGRCYK